MRFSNNSTVIGVLERDALTGGRTGRDGRSDRLALSPRLHSPRPTHPPPPPRGYQVQRGNQAGASSSAEIPPAVHGIRPFSSGGVPQVRYRGFLDALAHIYREGGVARLFKGSGARMAYHAPSTAIAMAIFEKAKGAWGSLLQ